MPEQNLIRSLLMSLAVGVVGTTTALGLAPVAGVASEPGAPLAVAPVLAAPAGVDLPVRRNAAAAGAPALAPAPAAAPVPDLLVAQRAAGLDCHLGAGDVPLCVHGEDHAPVAAGSSGGATPTSGRIGCYGNGEDGPRVRAVYARPQSSPNRYAASVPSIRSWAAGVSSQFDASAARTGGRRHVRFATTPGAGCAVRVLDVVLPDAAFRSFGATIDALQARGLDQPSSKYLVWADTTRYCGLATMYADDRPGPDNLNNGRTPSYARIDRPCWGKVEAHELVHMLGGIQLSARNATGAYHCNDGADVMCYDDGSPRSTQRRVCGDAHRAQLDCRNDDYFSTSAPAGSYLQTHWNTARSSFLSATLTDPAPAPARATSAPRPSPSASPSPAPAAQPRLAPLPDVEELLEPLPTLVPALLDGLGR